MRKLLKKMIDEGKPAKYSGPVSNLKSKTTPTATKSTPKPRRLAAASSKGKLDGNPKTLLGG